MDKERKAEERIRWFAEMLRECSGRKLWAEEIDGNEKKAEFFLQEWELPKEKTNRFGQENKKKETLESRQDGAKNGLMVREFAMNFQKQKSPMEVEGRNSFFVNKEGTFSFLNMEKEREPQSKQEKERGLFLDTEIPRERKSGVFESGFPFGLEDFLETKRKNDIARPEVWLENGKNRELFSIESEFFRQGEPFWDARDSDSGEMEPKELEQGILFSEDNQNVGRIIDELKEVISQTGSQQGAQNITVNISDVKETADVEEIMTLLSKRLLEERNTSRKKIGEG